MESYKEANKQINDYVQAITADKRVYASVERRRTRIATDLLTPKNETLIDIEYKKAYEDAVRLNELVTGKEKKYGINDQMMDVLKYLGDELNKDIEELGVNASQLDIDKLTRASQEQVTQLRNDVGTFVNNMENYNKIKELPLGSTNSIIPESNPAFINYVETRKDRNILLAPLPENNGFNLAILDKNGKINKESGVFPLTEYTRSMQAGEIGGYYEQVPPSEDLTLFYKDMDNLTESIMQMNGELIQQTGKGIFKSTEVNEKVAREYFTTNPEGKQLIDSFLEDEELLGYYKNMQYTGYMDKDKEFTTNNYKEAIRNYLVSKFNVPNIVQEPEEEQSQETPTA